MAVVAAEVTRVWLLIFVCVRVQLEGGAEPWGLFVPQTREGMRAWVRP